MRRFLRMFGIGSVAFLLIAQVVRVERSNPPVESEVSAPPDVQERLRAACYDCHSNETVWPWYSRVAPVSWLLAHDVNKGREDVNFSTWQRYDSNERRKKLKETIETVNEGEMPPWYYVIIHPEARLTDQDRAAIVTWANQGADG